LRLEMALVLALVKLLVMLEALVGQLDRTCILKCTLTVFHIIQWVGLELAERQFLVGDSDLNGKRARQKAHCSKSKSPSRLLD